MEYVHITKPSTHVQMQKHISQKLVSAVYSHQSNTDFLLGEYSVFYLHLYLDISTYYSSYF